MFYTQLQSRGCFTLNYNLRDVLHSTTVYGMFYTQLQSRVCFTLNYSLGDVLHSTTV
jgi:hypothetical protein